MWSLTATDLLGAAPAQRPSIDISCSFTAQQSCAQANAEERSVVWGCISSQLPAYPRRYMPYVPWQCPSRIEGLRQYLRLPLAARWRHHRTFGPILAGRLSSHLTCMKDDSDSIGSREFLDMLTPRPCFPLHLRRAGPYACVGEPRRQESIKQSTQSYHTHEGFWARLAHIELLRGIGSTSRESGTSRRQASIGRRTQPYHAWSSVAPSVLPTSTFAMTSLDCTRAWLFICGPLTST